MLKLTSVKKQSTKLNSGELVQYISVPEQSYRTLASDFKTANHLAAIQDLHVKEAAGILVKCHHMEDGLLAAAYIFRKYIDEHAKGEQAKQEDPFDDDDFPMDFDDEDDEEEVDDQELLEALFTKDGCISSVPVVTGMDMARGFMTSHQPSIGEGAVLLGWEGAIKRNPPYWLKSDLPLIIEDEAPFHHCPQSALEYLEQHRRFYIYVSKIPEAGQLTWSAAEIGSFEKTLLFETNIQYCMLQKPENMYYERLLHSCAKAAGSSLSKSVKRSQVIQDLIEYRGRHFRSSLDIETLVKKAVSKKGESRQLVKSDFDQLLEMKNVLNSLSSNVKASRASEELDKLIGLKGVKEQLHRIVKRMKFDKQRRLAGYPAADGHIAAVFMGAPGTAKTTTARILGKWLCEEGVLRTELFREVARKDLIGRYVGHTAPLIANLFEECQGGTIFIDEAYSLMSHTDRGGGDPFAEEALAEIIRQMENNPDTLLVFAGYSEEMKHFITHANPGLRSRLTNVLEFPNYSSQELCDIFTHFVHKEEYALDNPQAAAELIVHFAGEMNALCSDNLGNGRLMRKLFKTSVGYMAEREDHDLKLLKLADLQKAAEELKKAEMVVSQSKPLSRKIGFH